MIKFVVAKPIKKIKRHYTPVGSDKKKSKVGFRFFSVKLIWSIFGIFVVIYGGFLLLKNSIFNHQYTIKRVQYDSGDILWYDDPYMYKRINKRIKGENYYVTKWYKKNILRDIQSIYPIIEDISIEYRSSNTVFVKLSFYPLDLIIRNQDQRFGIIRSTLLPLYSGNKIAQGIKILDLPEYLSGLQSLSGIFFRQPATGLVQQVDLISQGLSGINRMEYLPGGERIIIYIDNKKLYINMLSDIQNQLKNYQLLKKYYKDYPLLKEIDLGSLEKDKVIVKK